METTEISPKIVWASVSTSGLENKVEHFKVARTKSVSYIKKSERRSKSGTFKY